MNGLRKSMARVLTVCCVAAVTAGAGNALAHDGDWDGGQCGKQKQHNFRKIEKKLNMTDAQKAKEIFTANRAVVKPIITSLRAEKKTLHDLMHADTIDEAAIRAESARIAGIQADLNVNRAKVGAQFRAILTPEQLVTLKALREKHHRKDAAPAAAPAPAK
jgi:Spy/CpxP family protein refolding chaperone